jgi:hypothetical protein
MIVLKDFKTVNQVFKAGDELYDDIENLEHWVSGEFVALEKFVGDAVITVTEVPTATFA